MHLRNIVLEGGVPVLFDAIEFDDGLATIDILYDLAFILMDFWQRGLRAHANLLFNRYLWRAPELEQELEGLAALPLFLALRAAIRALVTAALGDLDGGDHGAEARQFFQAAEDFLRPQPAGLVAIGGFSGSGKSTLAAALAGDLGRAPGAVHLRSDIERKRVFGVDEFEPLPQDAYKPEAHAQVYARLLHLSETALRAGQSVIVDAVQAKPDERAALAALATRLGVPFTGLWLEAPVETLVRRVAARRGDASDARESVVRAQARARWLRWIGRASMPPRPSIASCRRRRWRSIVLRWDKHGSPLQPAMAQIGQGFVGADKRVGGRMDGKSCAGYELQKIQSVLAGEIGDRKKLSFFPQEIIGKFRNIAHMDAGADNCAALFHRGEGDRHERADRRVNDRCIKLFRRRLIRSTGPDGAEFAGEILCGMVAGAGESENPASALLCTWAIICAAAPKP